MRATLALLGGLALATIAPVARAGAGEEDEAAKAYDVGAAAYDRGEFAVAARELARADELAPSPVALELAIHAALRADDPVLGVALADRVRARGASTEAIGALVRDARARFEPRVGRLVVRCANDAGCVARVDGSAVVAGEERVVLPGSHRVEVREASAGTEDTEQLDVAVEAGRTMAVMSAARRRRAPEPPPASTDKGSSRPLPPVVFWVGVGLTGALGATTIASGIDTQSRHEAFLVDRSDTNAAEVGRSAELRTNILLGVTGGLALVTTLAGLFFVEWSTPPAKKAATPFAVRF